MLRLLSLEYKKFRQNSVVSILTLFYIVLAPSLILVGKQILKYATGLPFQVSDFFEFPTVWDWMGYVGNWLVFFFLGFVVIYMITSEVANKTMRQGIINGMNRKDYFLAKLYAIFAYSLFATLLYIASTVIIGLFHTEGVDLELILDYNWAPIRYFIMCLGYLSFAMMVGFLIRNSGLAIFFYLIYVILLEVVLRYIQLYFWQSPTMKWYPMNVIEDLMPNPALVSGGEMLESSDIGFDIFLSYNEAMVGSIIYILIFIGISWQSFSKRDI